MLYKVVKKLWAEFFALGLRRIGASRYSDKRPGRGLRDRIEGGGDVTAI
jgi:hypothetical protein